MLLPSMTSQRAVTPKVAPKTAHDDGEQKELDNVQKGFNVFYSKHEDTNIKLNNKDCKRQEYRHKTI